MFPKIYGVRLAPVVLLLAVMLIAFMLPVFPQKIHEDPEPRRVEGVEDSENSAVALAPPPPYITSALAQTGSNNNITVVSWVKTGETIDLKKALSKLENRGYTVVELNLTEGFLEVQKNLYPLPRLSFYGDWKGWWNGKPTITITVRVYENGTIIAYTPPLDVSPSKEETYLGLLAYYDNSMNAPNLVTWFIVKEVLEILDLSQYINGISSGVPQYPDAKYVVFIWSDDDWTILRIEGFYQVSEGFEVVGAGLLLITYGTSYDSYIIVEINDQQLIKLYTPEHYSNYGVVNLHREDNDFFSPGVNYRLKAYEEDNFYHIRFFFVIVAILR